MAAKALPSQELLLQLLRYEPETGKLFWRERPAWMFKGEGIKQQHAAKRWNTKWAGAEAFTSIDSDGYHQGAIFYTRFLAHRVIVAMVEGFWPEEVDHENGIRSDNRFINLKPATHRQNAKNTSIRRNNKSGVVGVHWHKKAGKWSAMIGVDGGKSIYLGLFESLDDAAAARKHAEQKYGFHPNHGKKSCRDTLGKQTGTLTTL